MNTKELLEKYFEALKNKNASELENLFNADAVVETPVGDFNTRENFLTDFKTDRWKLSDFQLMKIMVDGDDGCVIYQAQSTDSAIGTLIFADWVTAKEGKVQAVVSNFDATPFRFAMAQI